MSSPRLHPGVEFTPGWYVVWYWIDDEHFTNQKFMDYDDAVQFAKEHGYGDEHES